MTRDFEATYYFQHCRTIRIGEQDFENGTVVVKECGIVKNCPMFQDDNGDIYFIYENEPIAFRDINW